MRDAGHPDDNRVSFIIQRPCETPVVGAAEIAQRCTGNARRKRPDACVSLQYADAAELTSDNSLHVDVMCDRLAAFGQRCKIVQARRCIVICLRQPCEGVNDTTEFEAESHFAVIVDSCRAFGIRGREADFGDVHDAITGRLCQ